jgi:altronate hydrolase
MSGGTFMGYRRPNGRVGTRNYVLIVPTSMCASHEASQISTIAEFTLYDREKYPNVDGVVAIPHNKGCGCQDGSTIDVMLRTLSNYADHPNVGGVILIDLGCEKTNLSQVESICSSARRRSTSRWRRSDSGSRRHAGAIQRGLKEVEQMLPSSTRSRAKSVRQRAVLGVKCGGSDGFPGSRRIRRSDARRSARPFGGTF